MPEEKARYLVERFTVFSYSVNGFKYNTEMEHQAAKQCALICVNEMYSLAQSNSIDVKVSNYLVDVEQEINKLKTIKL